MTHRGSFKLQTQAKEGEVHRRYERRDKQVDARDQNDARPALASVESLDEAVRAGLLLKKRFFIQLAEPRGDGQVRHQVEAPECDLVSEASGNSHRVAEARGRGSPPSVRQPPPASPPLEAVLRTTAKDIRDKRELPDLRGYPLITPRQRDVAPELTPKQIHVPAREPEEADGNQHEDNGRRGSLAEQESRRCGQVAPEARVQHPGTAAGRRLHTR